MPLTVGVQLSERDRTELVSWTRSPSRDDARVDEERLWVAILADVEAPHLRILAHLTRDEADQPNGMAEPGERLLSSSSRNSRRPQGPAIS